MPRIPDEAREVVEQGAIGAILKDIGCWKNKLNDRLDTSNV